MLYYCLHSAYMATIFDFGRRKCWWALLPKAACLLVPMRGVEPPTFALRMRMFEGLSMFIAVDIIEK